MISSSTAVPAENSQDLEKLNTNTNGYYTGPDFHPSKANPATEDAGLGWKQKAATSCIVYHYGQSNEGAAIFDDSDYTFTINAPYRPDSDGNNVTVYVGNSSSKAGVNDFADANVTKLYQINFAFGFRVYKDQTDEIRIEDLTGQGRLEDVNFLDFADPSKFNVSDFMEGKTKSKATTSLTSKDDAMLEADTSLWELPPPAGDADPSVHLIPDRTVTNILQRSKSDNHRQTITYGYQTEIENRYYKIINGKVSDTEYISQHKSETWRKGDEKKQPVPLRFNEDLDFLIKNGFRSSSKPFQSHICVVEDYVDQYGGHYHKNKGNCEYCYPNTERNRPDNLAPYLFKDVQTRLETGDYVYRGIIVVSSEKTADIWRSKGFLAIKLFGSESTTPSYFNDIQATAIAKLVHNKNIDIFVEVEKDPTGLLRINHKLISSTVGPLVETSSTTKIIPFTYHGDVSDKIDGEKAIAAGLTVDQITTGLDQIRAKYNKTVYDLSRANEKTLTPEQITELSHKPPISQEVELCPNHIWLTYGIPGPCQKYIDAIYETVNTEDENGNPKKSRVKREGVTNQDKIDACERCYINSEVRSGLLAKNIQHNQFGAFLPEGPETKNLIERTRYHLKSSGVDFTSTFVQRRFHNDGETQSYYTFTPHNLYTGLTATGEQIKHQLQELLPSKIYAQLVEVGFQIWTYDAVPYRPLKNYLDNTCGRLIGEDGAILEISSFARKDSLHTSVTIKGRKPKFPVLDEDGNTKIFGVKKEYTIPCEFIDYNHATNKERLALEEKPTTVVYNFGPSLTQKMSKILSDKNIDVSKEAMHSLTEGGSRLYIRDLHDFNKVKTEHNERLNRVIEKVAIDIATAKASGSNEATVFDAEYKSLIPGRGISARYYSEDQATASIPGLVFGEAAYKKMVEAIKSTYEVDANVAELIYDKIEPIQRAHPNLLPESVNVVNPDPKSLSDRKITLRRDTKPPGA